MDRTDIWDDLETTDVAQFESEFLAYMERNHADILKEIVDAGDFSEELLEQLHTAVKSFKDRFTSDTES